MTMSRSKHKLQQAGETSLAKTPITLEDLARFPCFWDTLNVHVKPFLLQPEHGLVPSHRICSAFWKQRQACLDLLFLFMVRMLVYHTRAY